MKTIILLSIFSVLLITFCSNPLLEKRNIEKSEILGKWGLFMTITNVGIDPIWDESSGTWIDDDTTTYCDTCINTIYIFNENEFSLFLSHSADASPKHSLFISTYALVNNTIESRIDTFKIESIQNGIMHLIKDDGYYFLKKNIGDTPPSYWPDWETDTTRLQ